MRCSAPYGPTWKWVGTMTCKPQGFTLESRSVSERSDGPERNRWHGCCSLRNFDGPAVLVVEGGAPSAGAPDPVTLEVELGNNKFSREIQPGSGWFALRFDVKIDGGEQEVLLSTDRTWKPSDVLHSADNRELGVALASVSLEPGGRRARGSVGLSFLDRFRVPGISRLSP